jgi:hypothetical protein
MQTLPRVSQEHQDRLRHYVDHLNAIADCLDSDCLDTAQLIERLPELRELHHRLTSLLIPDMGAIEVAAYPTPGRHLADRHTTAPTAREHSEIRRLIAAIGEFAEHPMAHADRGAVLALRRILFRLDSLLRTNLVEAEMCFPTLEDKLTPPQAEAPARALDHLGAERL